MNSRSILHLSGIFLFSAVQAAENFWDEIPLTPSTTRPSVVLDDYWNGQFQRVNREVAAAQDTSLVFFGDSITWSWSLGPATGRDLPNAGGARKIATTLAESINSLLVPAQDPSSTK